MKQLTSQLAMTKAEYFKFLSKFRSLQLSTIGENGGPESSYAPFVVDPKNHFFPKLSDPKPHPTVLL